MSSEDKASSNRKIAGILLLVIAIPFSIFVLDALINLWQSPHEIGMVKYFTEIPKDNLVLKTPEGDIELPAITSMSIGIFF